MRKDLVLFESQPDFADNSLYLYNHLAAQHKPGLTLEWLAGSDPSEKGIRAKANSRFGLQPATYWKMGRARLVFFSHNYPYFKRKKKGQTVVYMTHGCPVKREKIEGMDIVPLDYKRKPNFDYALCIGEGARIPQSIFCLCNPEIVLPLGYPRNDALLRAKGNSIDNPFMAPGSNKAIVWMPTFRVSNYGKLSESQSQNEFGLPLLTSADDLADLDRYLKEKKTTLIVKIHRLQADYPVFKSKYGNIVFVTDAELDNKGLKLYDMVALTDALLTDYSSIYFDYLVLDRPVGFTLDDYELYEHDRGYVYRDTKSVLAGHHIYDMGELKAFIDDMADGKDPHAEARLRVKEYFYGGRYDNASQRIAEHFGI